MGRVRLDMRKITPLHYRTHYHVCVDQSRNQNPEKDRKERESDKPKQKDATNKSSLQSGAKDRSQNPPAIPIDVAVPMTFLMLSAIPAAPPKIACVMLGMKSMFTMKATNTMMQGMRFASHISIE
jgi:hypothetical protein